MNYQISDTEYHSLSLVRDQIKLITGLLTLKDAELEFVTSDALYAFLNEREGEITLLLKSIDERHEAQLMDGTGAMQYFDWVHALRIARRDSTHTPKDAECRITQKLANAAKIDPDMEYVLNEWVTTLSRNQLTASLEANLKKPPAKPRKREKLAASA